MKKTKIKMESIIGKNLERYSDSTKTEKQNLEKKNEILLNFKDTERKYSLIKDKLKGGIDRYDLSKIEIYNLEYILQHIGYEKLDYILTNFEINKDILLDRRFICFLEDYNEELIKYLVFKFGIDEFFKLTFDNLDFLNKYNKLFCNNNVDLKSIKEFLHNYNNISLKKLLNNIDFFINLNKNLYDITIFLLNEKKANLSSLDLLCKSFYGLEYEIFKKNYDILKRSLGDISLGHILQLRDIFFLEKFNELEYILSLEHKYIIYDKTQEIINILKYSDIERLSYIINILGITSLKQLILQGVRYLIEYGDISCIDKNYNILMKQITGFDKIIYSELNNIWFARVLNDLDIENFSKIKNEISDPKDLFRPPVAKDLVII